MCEQQLSLYEDALISIQKADKLYKSIDSTNQGIRRRIDKLLPELLSRSKELSNWEKAVDICLKVILLHSRKLQPSVLISIIGRKH